MKDIDGSSVLDNSMIFYGGAIRDGNRHTHDNLPAVIAGGEALATQKAAKPSNMESSQKTKQEKTMAQVLLTGVDSASSSSITWYTYKSHE